MDREKLKRFEQMCKDVKQLKIEVEQLSKINYIMKILTAVAFILCLIFTMIIFVLLIARALSISIENQDEMLCKSAQVSRNKEYLEKCECFYKSKSINCLQGE